MLVSFEICFIHHSVVYLYFYNLVEERAKSGLRTMLIWSSGRHKNV